jgi:hypothetical protein
MWLGAPNPKVSIAQPIRPEEQQLAAMARSYIRFAAEHRPLFDVVYATMSITKRLPAACEPCEIA